MIKKKIKKRKKHIISFKGITDCHKEKKNFFFQEQNNNNNNLMHERNIHKNNFINFEELSKKYTFLNNFLYKNKRGKLSYDFEKSIAIYFLSKAILKEYYDINFYLPYVHEIDSIFDKFSLEDIYEHIFVNPKEINNLKQIILDAYNEHNNVLSKLENTNIQGKLNKLNINLTNQKEDIQIENQKKNFLCPCIPGRVNYIHFLADLASLENLDRFPKENENFENSKEVKICEYNNENNSKILYGSIVKVLDIGVGANCIYPLLGNHIYKWSFIGVDINLECLKISYINILINNKEKDIILKYQKDKNKIFLNVINNTDLFFFSMCNPPFYSFLDEVNRNPFRKLDANIDEVVYFDKQNIYMEKENLTTTTTNNNNNIIEHKLEDNIQNSIFSNYFGKNKKEYYNNNNDSNKYVTENVNKHENENMNEGESKCFNKNKCFNEIVTKCDEIQNEVNYKNLGGEYSFILKMINESSCYFYNIIWFSTLVSKLKNVKLIKNEIIKSMRLYSIHGRNQISFLNTIINNNIYFDNFFYFQNVKTVEFPVYISQYRIFKSYSGKLIRWIICWSYYNEQHIDNLKKLYYDKIIKMKTKITY
ncbi:conserved Plasmodium protein, unknown function [Plasmodium gallinaceum]|uniref:Methyltransferase n=1 Tax=Plasmodium gallinaceum TaxID=5849 RepID=A0A1J1GT06_PLAGA|nr:conserved Plasmodium protein, unknown function [Plasmodium gallinaceum]CRG95636.1 conserved Plasmodium protein, unknown function [Plasmodium gallinaceum]